MTSLWIGPDEYLSVGDVGFLIEKTNVMHNSTYYVLRDTPAHTNQSHEPRLNGWCGTDNDIATYARGVVRVSRVAKNGRAYVNELDGADLAAALDDLGYPEMASA